MAKSNCGTGKNCGSNKLFYTQPFADNAPPPPFVEFTAIDAIINATNVNVSWSINTGTSIGLDHFRVERSRFGIEGTFEPAPGGDPIALNVFTFQDTAPFNNIDGDIIGYYRIVAVDANNIDISISNEIQVHL